ncbi:MAG: hypothetical protein ACR2PG_13055 [Hyphomicrobiaceae bacterium]
MTRIPEGDFNMRYGSSFVGILLTLMVFVAGASLKTDSAQAASITGRWSGGGTVQLSSGGRERVRCRVTYRRIAGQRFSVYARCASSGTKIDQLGQLRRVSKSRYVGSVRNQQYNVSANVVVIVSGKRQTVSLSSSAGSARLRLRRR